MEPFLSKHLPVIIQKSQQIFTWSKTVIKALEEDVKYVHLRRSDVFIANFEHILHIFLALLLLILNN